MHPELSWRLARAKIDEARSGAQRASALPAAALDLQVSRRPAGTRRMASMPAMITGSRVRAWSLRARAARTAKG
jgi:hypothetical protein